MTRGAIRIFLLNFMKKDRKIYGLFKILLTKGGKNATLETYITIRKTQVLRIVMDKKRAK